MVVQASGDVKTMLFWVSILVAIVLSVGDVVAIGGERGWKWLLWLCRVFVCGSCSISIAPTFAFVAEFF